MSMKNLEYKLDNLKKAYEKLCMASQKYVDGNEFIRDSLIQRFEFTYELSHKTLAEFLQYMGVEAENSYPRSVFKKAFKNNIISDEKLWLRLLEDRNMTSHIYNESVAIGVAERIKGEYVAAFGELIAKIEEQIKSC